MDEVLTFVGKKYNIEREAIVNNISRSLIFERNLSIYLVMQNPRYTLVEKGRLFGISGAGFAMSYQRFLKKIKASERLALEVEQLRKGIYGDWC